MAVDDLAPCGARSSAAMVLIYFSQDINVSEPEGLTNGSLDNTARILKT